MTEQIPLVEIKEGVSTEASAISADSVVTLHFELTLEPDNIIDSTFSKQPATFRMGDGSLLPGFEKVLLGLEPGDEQLFSLAPDQAFGERNQANVRNISRTRFPGDMILESGLVVGFNEGEGEVPGVVLEVGKESVTVDFNHPLSGKAILFRVKIISTASVQA